MYSTRPHHNTSHIIVNLPAAAQGTAIYNPILWPNDERHPCCICGEITVGMSFTFGYGSRHDGEPVCWKCAERLDDVVDILKHKIEANKHA